MNWTKAARVFPEHCGLSFLIWESKFLASTLTNKKNGGIFLFPVKKGEIIKLEPVRYEVIFFEDREKRQAMITALKEKAPAFIEQQLIEMFKAKQTTFTAIHQSVNSIEIKQWKNLPKHKITTKRPAYSKDVRLSYK